MKKILSTLLALVLVLSLATVAFADEATSPTWDGKYAATTATEFKEIVKTYTSENNVVVNETLSFTSTASTKNPDHKLVNGVNTGANLTVADLTVSSLTPGTLIVTIPALSVAGTYEWTIKEDAGNTAGVTYSNAEVHVIALVEYDNTNHKLVIAQTSSYIKKENGEKAKTFTNTFNSGEFTVAKDVIGNMANENDEFEISVTLTSTQPIGTNVTLAGTTVAPAAWTAVKNGDGKVTSWTYTSTLNYSDAAGAKTFADIPTGVTVAVAETTTDDKMNGYEKVGIYSGDYTVSGTTVTGNDFTTLNVVDDTDAKITVVNSKTSSIETGVALDSMPYFVMLSVACVGMFLLLTKKRATREF